MPDPKVRSDIQSGSKFVWDKITTDTLIFLVRLKSELCKKWWRGCLCVVGMVLVPGILWAQDGTDSFHGLQLVLENLYDQMIPLSSQLIGVGRAIGGFAALFFIASRVWGHLARAESIDLLSPVYPSLSSLDSVL